MTTQPKTKIVTVVFEVDSDLTSADLHEHLCQVIHEGNLTSLDVLSDNILDIQIIGD